MNVNQAVTELAGLLRSNSFSSQSAFEAALELEVIGREGNLAQAEEAYSTLEKEIVRLNTALEAYGNETVNLSAEPGSRTLRNP